MPPCLDVYVWVRTDDRAIILSRFIDRYVDTEQPGEPRFGSFMRTFVSQRPVVGDREALADLRRDESAGTAFSLYLRAKTHYEAIVTIIEEENLVFGLGLDDPDNDAETLRDAAALMATLKQEFAATAGIAGVELRPPQSLAEWETTHSCSCGKAAFNVLDAAERPLMTQVAWSRPGNAPQHSAH